MTQKPSANGRQANGRFAPGNKASKGNPFMAKMNSLRKALMSTVSIQDIKEIFRELIAKAKEGDEFAIREVLDRTVGKADSYATLFSVMENNQKLDELLEIVRDKPFTTSSR